MYLDIQWEDHPTETDHLVIILEDVKGNVYRWTPAPNEVEIDDTNVIPRDSPTTNTIAFTHNTSTTVITLQDGSLRIPHFRPSRPSSLGFTTKHTRSHSSLSNGPVLVMVLSSSLVTITEHEYTLLRVRSISTSSR